MAEGAEDEKEKKAEDQYRKMGAAYAGVAMQILCLCVDGQTTTMQQTDSETSWFAQLRDLLCRLHAERENRKSLEEISAHNQ